MVELDAVTYRKLAARAGLSIQFVYKEHRLMEVVAELLEANSELKTNIILKGGTGLNKIYFGEEQRFSEDIDFDYAGNNSDEEKISSLKKLVKNLKGFTLAGPWRYYNTIRFHCGYQFMGQKDHIRLEFNLQKKIKTLEPIAITSITSAILGIRHFGMPAYSLDDMLARKLNALRDRCEGKDIWDAYYGLPKARNLKKAVQAALDSENLKMNAGESFVRTIEKLGKVDIKKEIKIVNPYIPSRFRPKNWQDLIAILVARLEQLK